MGVLISVFKTYIITVIVVIIIIIITIIIIIITITIIISIIIIKFRLQYNHIIETKNTISLYISLQMSNIIL